MRLSALAWIALAFLLGFAGVIGINTLLTNTSPQRFAQGTVEAFEVHTVPRPAPVGSFTGPDGTEIPLEAFRGRTVLVNLWATWCAPCVKELPELDALQAAMGSEDFEVVVISVDRGDSDTPRAFLADLGIETLAFYHDPTTRFAQAFETFALPVTALINAEGQELGRLIGPADWNAPEARSLIANLAGMPAPSDERTPGS